jgi:hypothetical protein
VKKNLLFFVSLLGVVGTILNGGGIRRPLGCCAGRPFGQGASLQVMLFSFRWEGWDLTICTLARIVVMLQGGGGGGVRGV